MKITAIVGCIVLLCLASVAVYSCSRRITRKLLTDNRVYHWKVYHVTENNYPAGKDHYFEVYYGKQQLVLPKEMTGGVRDISRFHAAGGFDNNETQYDTLLILFEAISKDDKGFEQRDMVSMSIRPVLNKEGKFMATNLCTGKTAEVELAIDL